MTPRLITLTGSPFDMGLQHGRLLKEQIHFMAKERYLLAIEHAAEHGLKAARHDCLRLAHQHLTHHERYSPAVFEEFEGIARGAQISLEELLIGNALTDFRDVLWQQLAAPAGVPGCTAFGLRRRRTQDHVTCIGQNWDMHASAEPAVHIFHRQPEDGPSSLAMSVAGGLALVGINEVGIAVCNNNLQSKDARPGVSFMAMIHESLRQTHFDAACRAITDAHRSAGHNYLLADDEGTIVDIETTAELADEFQPKEPHYVHTNHYLSPRLQALEVDTDLRSSRHRFERLSDLLDEHEEPLTLPALQKFLSDREGEDELCICREGKGREPRTCAFIVLCPERRELWLTVGPPSRSQARRFGLN
jgi:isopenicillin-N N-acyltransferase-like protein